MNNPLTRNTVAPRALGAALPGRVMTLPIGPGSMFAKGPGEFRGVALASLGNGSGEGV